MYESKEKYINNKSDGSTCFACLSCDRKLNRIDSSKQYIDVLKIICDNSSIITLQMSQQLFVCWECDAVLKKIKLFKSKVAEAQKLLAYHVKQKKKTMLTSLSSLTINSNNNVIYCNHDEYDDDKKVLEIKQESNECDDFEYNQGVSSDHSQEEIKNETEPKRKCMKIKNTSHYRIVYGSNIFKKSLLRKRLCIKRETIPKWLEKERDSKFYSLFMFKCKMCFYGFNCEEKLEKHNFECHDKSLGENICIVCNARFSTQADLNTHELSHEVAYECAQCGYKSYTVRRINAHIHTHRLVQCVYCDVCLPNIKLFHNHYKKKHSVFICDYCGKKSTTKRILEKHISNHHVTTHTCSKCSRQYKSRAALNKHQHAKHSAAPAELAYCVRCDKQFDSAPVYRRHVLNTSAHAHETPQATKKKVPCPECGNIYSRRTYMMNHYRHVHTNQSKHYCSQCDRHFLNRTRFIEHMRYNHEGIKKEKNKLCNVCGKGFATNRILMNHIRTHSGERPFQCEHCSAKFTQKHSMLSHVKYIHLKTKRRGTWQH